MNNSIVPIKCICFSLIIIRVEIADVGLVQGVCVRHDKAGQALLSLNLKFLFDNKVFSLHPPTDLDIEIGAAIDHAVESGELVLGMDGHGHRVNPGHVNVHSHLNFKLI